MHRTTWQFLIQREGDRSWLPIEAGGEIPEGRYRLAARTSYPNAPVAAEIAYIADRGDPLHPKTQRRSYQTTANGLLMLFPYSKIRVGTLTVRCIVHPVGSAPEQHQAKLHVLNQETDGGAGWDDWQPDLTHSMSVPNPLAANTSDRSGEELSQPDMHQIEALQAMVATAQIQLASEAIVTSSQEPIHVDGTVQLEVNPVGIGQAWQGIVKIALQDPQTTAILVQVEHRIQVSCLEPLTQIPFRYPLTLPDRITTHVVLGEIALYVPDAHCNTTPLATESFMVTVGLQDLLKELASSIAQDLSEAEAEATIAPSAAQPAKRPLDLTFMSMLNSSRPVSQPAAATIKPSLQKSSSQPLTPSANIAPASKPKTGSWQAVQLPTLAGSAVQAQPDRPSESLSPQSLEQPDELLSLIDHLATMDEDMPTDDRPAAAAIEQSDSSDQPTHDGKPSVASEADTIDTAFRGLNLQQRFWARLNDLVGDAELAQWVAPIILSEPDGSTSAESMVAMSEESDRDQAPANPTSDQTSDQTSEQCLDPQSSSSVNTLEDIWLSQEIVVDDDFSLPERKAPTQADAIKPQVAILPDDYPLPTPELHVPIGELIAGKSIPIRITIPDLAAQLCVKLWFVDYQTRSVVDEPRWLVSFLPDGAGNVEAVTYVSVPMGSVEIQIAAIVVEIPTQRESHRATVERKVVPANLPVLALEALEL